MTTIGDSQAQAAQRAVRLGRVLAADSSGTWVELNGDGVRLGPVIVANGVVAAAGMSCAVAELDRGARVILGVWGADG